MINVEARPGAPVLIGRVGENAHREVRFRDAAAFLGMYPNAGIAVLHQRPGDAAAYQVDDLYVSVKAGAVCWEIMDGDTEKAGSGQCEIVFTQGGVVAKSMIYETRILPALNGSADPPEPPGPWDAETVIERIQAMQAVNTSNPFAVYDATVGSGTGVTEETWTDDDGTHTATITVLYVTKPEGYSVKAGDLILVKMTQHVVVDEYSFFGLSMGDDEIEEHIIVNVGKTEYPAGTAMFRKDQVYLFRARSAGAEAGFDMIWGP